MKKNLLFLTSMLFVSLLFSCKNEKKSDTENFPVKEDIKVKENFNVEITASSSKKDDFAVYFTENNSIDFKSEDAVWNGMKGANGDENLYFELTEDRIPTNIRLDLGLNKDQDSVTIKTVKVNYLTKSFQFNGNDFFTYFNKDEQFTSKINDADKSITFYKTGAEYKTPYFYPTPLNNDKVKEITTRN
jgi:hypothetical protein